MRSIPFLLAAFLVVPLAAETQKPASPAPASAPAAQDSLRASRKDVLRLVRLFGWPTINSEAARQQLRTSAKDPKLAGYPASYWKEYEDAASPEAFERILVPIFEKAYTRDEVRFLLKFASSPEFKLFLEKSPDVRVKKDAFDAFSKYMTETGKKLADQHAAPAKK